MREIIRPNKYILLIIIFSLLGLFISSKLLTLDFHFYKRGLDTFESCQVNSVFNCGKVSASDYSEMFGFPNMILGIIFYTVIFITFAFLLFKAKFPRWTVWGILVLAFGGLIFSLYLLYISLFILRSACLYCLTSFVSSAVIFVSVLLFVISNEEMTFSNKISQKYNTIATSKYRYSILTSILLLLYALVIGSSQLYYKKFFDSTFSLESALLLPINAVKVLIKLLFS